MYYYVYLLITTKDNKNITYVGYTKDLKKRLIKHNSSKGAKFTRGRLWKMIYKERYDSKSKAIKAEYKLKKNYLLRKEIKKKFLNERKNYNNSSL
tara:strand:+ start:47 stop:331 length:285 start_codon:yes stop_codon:yes gene_type:complete